MACNWPNGACACKMEEESKPDPAGRVWMHCEQGLTYTKASVARFVMFCLGNNVEIGDLYAFDPTFRGSQVLAAIRIRPDQFDAFEAETGGKLRKPPNVTLNATRPMTEGGD